MLNTINSDLIRGNITTIILKALYEGDRYGYDIVKEIEQKSSGQYTLKQPTLYSCLKRLEMQGFIRSYWGARTNGGRRKYYTLTDMGKEIFQKNRQNWEYSRTVIDKLISDKEYELSEEDVALDFKNTDFVDEINDDELISDDSVDSDDDVDFNADSNENKTYLETDLESSESEVAASESVTYDYSNHEATSVLNNLHDASNQHEATSEQLIDQLFNSHNESSSYTQKLINEKYTAPERSRSYVPETYFNDFTDAYNESIGVIENDATNVTTSPTSTSTALQNEVNENSFESLEEDTSEFVVPPLKQKSVTDGFISYNNAKTSKIDEDKLLLEREYKNVLGRLINDKPVDENKISTQQLPFTDEMKQNIARVAKTTTSDYPISAALKEQALSENLDKVAFQTKQLTGDNIRNRIYDGRTDTQFRTTYHYYSNKIMLLEYFILFALMLLMTVTTFVIERTVIKISLPHNSYFYLLGILLSVALPVYAAIMNFKDPFAVKTYTQNLKDKLIFRLWAMSCCLIIIYCLNIIIGMPHTMDISFLPSLLLPALFSLILPLDVAVFYLLYKSGSYNQK